MLQQVHLTKYRVLGLKGAQDCNNTRLPYHTSAVTAARGGVDAALGQGKESPHTSHWGIAPGKLKDKQFQAYHIMA